MAKKHRKKRREHKRADKHALYQESVQDPSFEVDLITRFFKRRVGRKPRSLREDFCGTALLCAKWVEGHRKRSATGVDIDGAVLHWGREHNVEPLGEDAARVSLVEGDVRDPHEGRHDVVVALNYSYFCFKQREVLRGYFEAAREHLAADGLPFLDLFGGWEAQQVLVERRKLDGFRYTWEQRSFNPITADLLAHIHFDISRGVRLEKAFTYDWRLWTLPELRELLGEAGFEHVEVLWEDEDEDGEGNGHFRSRVRVPNDPGWNAYLMASVRPPPLAKKKKPQKGTRASSG